MNQSSKSSQRRRKESKKTKKTYKYFPVLFRFLLIIVLFIGVAIVGVIGGTLYGYIDTTKELNTDNLKLNFTSFVYYIDNETKQPAELERLYGEENRIWVGINQIPLHMQNAFIAIEDQRFRQHPGFDVKRTIGATINYILKHDSSYGGSTITQQLIKNLTGDDDVSPKRKIQEIWRSINLEKHLSKDQILEYYLNTLYLSQGCNGVQAAANTYFGEDVSELSLAQSASIAGITQYPSRYDPFLNPEKNKEKQELVLKKMLELGYINQDEYDSAKNENLEFKRGTKQQQTSRQSYFVDQVINDVLNDLVNEKKYSKQLATKLLYTGGLKIYSTIDPNVQNVLDKIFTDEKFLSSNLFPVFNGETQPEAAMIVIDPYSGQIKGMVGGLGQKTANRTLNRATQTKRQPGSSIKPIGVYAPALEYGYITPGTVIDDVPVVINPGTPMEWSPRNWYKDGFWGLSTIRRAVEWSMNVVAVKVLDRIGIDKSFDFLRNNLGITSLIDREKRADGKIYSDKQHNSLALGGLTDGISVIEMAAAYVPFANRGIYTRPYTYTKVLDHDGNVLLEKEKKSHIAMSEQTAFLMTMMLQNAVDNGTGGDAKLSVKIPAAGKTGSTSDNKDKWFSGFTPYYVGSVWYGFDDPKSMEKELSGKPNPAAILWRAAMNEINKDLATKEFSEPSGIVKVTICKDSGQKPSELCYKDPRGSRVYTEYFKKGTEPTTECTTHVLEKIDTTNNLLANEYCPPDVIEERLFIVRPQPYVPIKDQWGNTILPADTTYELPAGEYCNEHGPKIEPEYNIFNDFFRRNRTIR